MSTRYVLRRYFYRNLWSFVSRGAVLWMALCAAGAVAQPGTPQALANPEVANLALPAGAEILERGPVHEAFAEPLDLDVPSAGPVVAQKPPEPIEEAPPEVRPEGERIEWIGGYWMWAEDRGDFVWVSGVWRHLPPGRVWTPGYWAEAPGGFQWISGFWGVDEVLQNQFLPLPPATLEMGPSSPAPAANHFWVPGCWRWQAARYVWQPGYWYAGQANWVWIPNHYVYSPLGCVFVPGYWDFTPENRGWLFAPAYFPPTVYAHPGFVYRPQLVVDANLFLTTLFVNPHYHHYCFGVYDRGLATTLGWQFWVDFGFGRGTGRHHRYYDPLAAFYHHRHGPGYDAWAQSLRTDFGRLAQHGAYAGRGGRASDHGGAGTGFDHGRGRPDGRGDFADNGEVRRQLVRSLEQIAKSDGQKARLHRMSSNEIAQRRQQSQEVAARGARRIDLESHTQTIAETRKRADGVEVRTYRGTQALRDARGVVGAVGPGARGVDQREEATSRQRVSPSPKSRFVDGGAPAVGQPGEVAKELRKRMAPEPRQDFSALKGRLRLPAATDSTPSASTQELLAPRVAPQGRTGGSSIFVNPNDAKLRSSTPKSDLVPETDPNRLRIRERSNYGGAPSFPQNGLNRAHRSLDGSDSQSGAAQQPLELQRRSQFRPAPRGLPTPWDQSRPVFRDPPTGTRTDSLRSAPLQRRIPNATLGNDAPRVPLQGRQPAVNAVPPQNSQAVETPRRGAPQRRGKFDR